MHILLSLTCEPFDFIIMINCVIVDVGAIQMSKVVSLKDTEMRLVLVALENALKNGFVRLYILLDAQGVIRRSPNGQARRLARSYFSIRRDVD